MWTPDLVCEAQQDWTHSPLHPYLYFFLPHPCHPRWTIFLFLKTPRLFLPFKPSVSQLALPRMLCPQIFVWLALPCHWKFSTSPHKHSQFIETHSCYSFSQQSVLFPSGTYQYLKVISPVICFSVCLFPGLRQNAGFRTQSYRCQICLRLLTPTASAGISPNHPQFY